MIIKLLAALVLPSTLAGASGASASAVSHSVLSSATTSSARIAAGHGTSLAGGVVQINGYSDNDGSTLVVVLSGAIGDYGKADRTNSKGDDGGQLSRLHVVASRGSFQMEVSGLEGNLLRAFGGFPTDRSTCSGNVTVSGPGPIVAGSGRGQYRGITGTFDLTITINEVDSWPNCSGTTPYLAQSVFLSGTGRVSFDA